MYYSKKTILAGAIVAACAMGFVLYERSNFLTIPKGGQGLFLLALLLSVLAGAGFAIRPDFEAPSFRPRLYRVWIWLVFFAAPLVMVIAVERLNGNFLSDLYGPDYILDNYLMALMFYLFIFACTGRISTTVISVGGLFLGFGITNMYVKEFKGSPFLPLDAGSIATASKVAGDFDYDIGFEIAFAVVLFLVLMGISWGMLMPPGRKKRWKIVPRLVAVLVVLVSAILFYCTPMPVELGMKPDFFNQMRGYEHRGAIREFMNNTRYLRHSAPDGYNADQVESLMEAAIKAGSESGEVPYILDSALAMQGEAGTGVSSPTAATTPPDIIVIMNESFSDLSKLGDFTTNQAVMPFLSSLTEASQGKAKTNSKLTDHVIAGDLYVSVRGTGTSNTEFEFLTGNSMAFLPVGSNAYQLYVKDEQPGLVTTLLDQGYAADAAHPYFASNWSRPTVYEYMHFDRYVSMEDMVPEDIGGEYIKNGEDRYLFTRQVQKAYPHITAVVEGNLSDEFDYMKLIEMYEARDPHKPYFQFNITMQNHTPYTTQYSNFPTTMELPSMAGDYPKAAQYLTRIHESDRAFRDLLTYFAGVDHPVIVLFFGDHQPIIEESFFKELAGKDMVDWTNEEAEKLYITPFVLWANYDIPEGYIDRISVNYLSTLLLQTAGLKMPAYNDYLATLYENYPVITAQGCRDAAGNFFLSDTPKDETASQMLGTYAKIMHNNLTDIQHRVDRLFRPE